MDDSVRPATGDPHRVSRHLRLEVAEYDAAIRRFIPGYEAMLEAAASAVLEGSPRHVLDLGAGTGALSEVLLRRDPDVRVTLVDVDPEMLADARARLAPFTGRVQVAEQSFAVPLPRADAAMASLALHHIPTLEEKARVYASIAAALSPVGVLVNADVTMPEEETARRADFDGWADHLVANGISREDAFRHFEAWSEEDTYFSVPQESGALESAGYQVTVPWRAGVSTVVVARKAN